MPDFLAGLPTWVVILIGVLAAAILVLLNIGWLLQAKAMLDGYAKRRTPTASPPVDPGRAADRPSGVKDEGGGSEGGETPPLR